MREPEGEKPASSHLPHLVGDAIRGTSVPQLLGRAANGVVVLERIAGGAGSTRWFLLRDAAELTDLEQRISTGSLVSFYFDGRLATRRYDREVASTVLRIADQDHDAVIGRLRRGEIEIEVEFVAGPSELHAYESRLAPGEEVIFGRFPAAEDDGQRAVTITIPDPDGVVRGHPY